MKTETPQGPRDLPVMHQDPIAQLMALHDHASELRHTHGAPVYNTKARDARVVFETALRELLGDATSNHALKIVLLHSEGCKTLMSKGHHEKHAFMSACRIWNGGELTGWGDVMHGWHRSVPDRTGEYQMMMYPAVIHARGAYPTTTIDYN